jgi:hypothetical protein
MTLSDLITIKTRDEVLKELLTALQVVGFPAASWGPYSVPRRLLTAVASVYAAFTVSLVLISRGGLLLYARTGWLTMLALSFYQITRYAEQQTKGTLVISDTASAGPWTFAAGELWFDSQTGKRFYNTTAFTLELDGTVAFEVAAEEASSTYNVAADTILSMVTSVPGTGFATTTPVTVTPYSGTPPTVSVSGTPGGKYEFLIEIESTGILGAATFRWSDDGGDTWQASGVTVPGGGSWAPGPPWDVTVTFAAGTYTDGDEFRWNTNCTSFNPSTEWITTSGRDEETDDELVVRCNAKWATLGYGQNDDWWRYYALNTPTYGSEVTRVRVDTDPLGTGTVTITLAGSSGAVSATCLAGVNSYLQSIKSNTTTLVVQNATNVNFTITTRVWIDADYQTETPEEVNDAIMAYFGSVEMGGTVYRNKLIDAIQWDDDHVLNSALTLPASDTSLGDTEVPVLQTLNLTVTGV